MKHPLQRLDVQLFAIAFLAGAVIGVTALAMRDVARLRRQVLAERLEAHAYIEHLQAQLKEVEHAARFRAPADGPAEEVTPEAT